MPEQSIVNPTATEVLTSKGKVDQDIISRVGTDVGMSPEGEVRRGQKFADLLKEKTKEMGGKDAFAERLKMGTLKNAAESVYEKEEVGKMRSEFGAGEVTVKKDGTLKGPEGAVEMAKEGRSQIDKLTNFLDYSGVQIEINKGKSLDEALIERKIVDAGGMPANIIWSNMREKALDDVLQSGVFTEANFPFLNKNLVSLYDRRSIIENTIASDPSLQKKIVEKVKELQKEKLPKVKYDKSNRATRMEKEGELVGKLSDVMPQAISEVLIERYDKVQEVAKEQRQKETDEGLKKLTKAMDINWISYDSETRSRNVKTKQLGEDITYIAYHGQEGVDRLLIRDLKLELKDDQGNPLKDESGNPFSPDTAYKNVDLSKLSSKDKDILAKAKEKYGNEYQKKLMSDFGEARVTEKSLYGYGFIDKNLRTKPFEWMLLNKNFGDQLEKDVRATTGGEALLKQLKENGVDRQKDKKSWLLALLFALGVSVVEGLKGAQDIVKTDAGDAAHFWNG